MILHLSDFHLTENGAPVWNTDTMAHFQRAIEQIREMEHVDAIIITGDMSDDGSLWTYEYIDRAFQSLGIPTYCCLGNHDDSSVFLREFRPNFIQHLGTASVDDWRIIFIDSTIPGMSRGRISDKRLEVLEQELSEDSRQCIIAFHHPPMEPGGWLNKKLLENRSDFMELISRYDQVKLVLFGHIHCSMQHMMGGALLSSAPSVGFAYSMNLPKYVIADGEEGFNQIELSDQGIVIKTITLIPPKT